MNEFIDALEGELMDAARRRAAARPRRRVRLPRLPLRPLAAGALASAFVVAGVAALDRRPDERAVVPAAPAGGCAPSDALLEAAPALRHRDPADRPTGALSDWIADSGRAAATRRFAVRLPAARGVDVWLVPSLPCDGAPGSEGLCVAVAGKPKVDDCAATANVRKHGHVGTARDTVGGVGPRLADAVNVLHDGRRLVVALHDGAFATRAPADASWEVEWAYRTRFEAAGGDVAAARAELDPPASFADLFAPRVRPAPARRGSYVAHSADEGVADGAIRAANALGITDVRTLPEGEEDDVVIVIGEDWRP